ncbi:unnamed protein product [Closterium sp. NIES-53]
MAPIPALTSPPLRFRPHPPSTVPPLLPLPSLLSAPFAAPSSLCTSPTCHWTSPLLHPSAWIPMSHQHRRSSTTVTSRIGSLVSVFSMTMPSQDSILCASPLMDSLFVVPLSPPFHNIASQSPSPTAAALSLPRTLDFFLESAATDSILCDAGVLHNFPRPLSIDGAGETMTMICTGTSSLPCPASPSSTVTGLYVPSCCHNLLSLPALQRLGVRALFPAGELYCDPHYHDRHLAHFTLSPTSRLYTLRVPIPSSVHHISSSSAPSISSCECRSLTQPTLLLHHRLCHPKFPLLRSMVTSNLLHDLPPSLPPLPPSPAPPCTPCVQAKLSQSPHPSSPSVSPKPLDLVHMDLWGPSPIASRQGNRYFLLLVDDHSRFATIYPLRAKSDAPSSSFAGLSRRAFALAVLSQASTLMVVASSLTTLSFLTAPLMAFAKPPPFRILPNRMLLTGRQPSARPLRVWGCVPHVLINPADRARQGGKLAPKTQLCAFIGINVDCPGYPFYAPSSQQLIRSQDVIFDETRSPFLTPPPTPPPPSLHWSEFDPLPSAAPSPSPLPPPPTPPPLPAPSTPPSAVISGTSPPPSSSSAPMPSSSQHPSPLPPSALAPPPSPSPPPSAPAPPPSPRLTRSMTRAMSNFQHSALFTSRLHSSLSWRLYLFFRPQSLHSHPPPQALHSCLLDDLVLLAENYAALAAIKHALQAHLLCKDLGELRHYLAMEIRRYRAARTISLSQSFYDHSILERFEMSQAKPVSTPLPANHQLTAPAVPAPSSELRPYPELVGSLMYAMMCTRHDLAYPLNVLSRFVGLGRHTDVHWAAAKCVLRYLCATSDLALTLGGSSPPVLSGYTGAPLVHPLFVFPPVRLSCTQAHWRLSRLSFLLAELGRSHPSVMLFCDSASMIHLIENPIYHARNKHIEVRYFFVRQLLQSTFLCLRKVDATANLVDIFIKALLRAPHRFYVRALGLIRLATSGGVHIH